MTWYAAHLISYVEFRDGVQDKYPFWENVVLIEATSPEQAREEAQRIGMSHYDDRTDGDNTFHWEERPARWVYAGLRKLIECQDTTETKAVRLDESSGPVHGTEITYSQMEVATSDELQRLVSGEAVTVMYEL